MTTRRYILAVLFSCCLAGRAEVPSVNSILLGAKSVTKAQISGFGAVGGSSSTITLALASSDVQLSTPVSLQLPDVSQSTVQEIGFFNHPVVDGAPNFFASPTNIALPNDLFPELMNHTVTVQDVWGVGSTHTPLCTDIDDVVTQLFFPIWDPIGTFAEQMTGLIVPNVQQELQKFTGNIDKGCSGDLHALINDNQELCTAYAAASMQLHPSEHQTQQLDAECSAAVSSMKMEGTPPSNACAFLCSVVNSRWEQVVVADVRQEKNSVMFDGRMGAPYADLLYTQGGVLNAAAEKMATQPIVTLLSDGLQPLLGFLQTVGELPKILGTMAQWPNVAPVLAVHRPDAATGVYGAPMVSWGLLEPKLPNGQWPVCLPFKRNEIDQLIDAVGNVIDDDNSVPVPLSSAELSFLGCAAERQPVDVLLVHLFKHLRPDIVVINRGYLADNPTLTPGFATVYEAQDTADADVVSFTDAWRYKGFVKLGAEPAGAVVIRDMLADGVRERVAVTTAALDGQGPAHLVSIVSVNSDGFLFTESVPVAFEGVPESDLHAYRPIDLASGDFNHDGRADLAMTWVRGATSGTAAEMQFSPYVHVLLGNETASFTMAARYSAPATKEDAAAIAEGGGPVTNGAAQLSTVAICDLNRDGRQDLCVGNQHPYTQEATRKVFVHYYRGFGNGLFDEATPRTYQANTREDFLPDPGIGNGGVRQIVVDQFQNLGVVMGAPRIFPALAVPVVPVCGNMVKEPGEACDGEANCSDTCQIIPPPECGNGVLETGEQCDDGNLADGDGCSATCTEEDFCPTVPGNQTLQFDPDGDKLPDACDNCPDHANPQQADDDGDSIGNACDSCPQVSNKDNQTDTDNDGYGDACDACPNEPALHEKINGSCVPPPPTCSELGWTDADSDGLLDTPPDETMTLFDAKSNVCMQDKCSPWFWSKFVAGLNASGTGYTFTDPCVTGNCADPTNADTDNDGFGDVCDDFCWDLDKDGVGDMAFGSKACTDNCKPLVDTCLPDKNGKPMCWNDQVDKKGAFDSNGKSIGNGKGDYVCEVYCGDGTVINPVAPGPDDDWVPPLINDKQVCDNCAAIPNLDQKDTDHDGIGNACEISGCENLFNANTSNNSTLDSDGDGIPDVCDNCPTELSWDLTDTDGDNVGDICDVCPGIKNINGNIATDTDGDGVPGACDNCLTKANPNQADADGNGIGDACEVQPMPASKPGSAAPSSRGESLPTQPASSVDLQRLEMELRKFMGTFRRGPVLPKPSAGDPVQR